MSKSISLDLLTVIEHESRYLYLCDEDLKILNAWFNDDI